MKREETDLSVRPDFDLDATFETVAAKSKSDEQHTQTKGLEAEWKSTGKTNQAKVSFPLKDRQIAYCTGAFGLMGLIVWLKVDLASALLLGFMFPILSATFLAPYWKALLDNEPRKKQSENNDKTPNHNGVAQGILGPPRQDDEEGGGGQSNGVAEKSP